MTLSKTFAALAVLAAASACSPKGDAQPSAPPAAEATPAAETPGVARFTIGTLDAFAVLDGELRVPNDGEVFGVGRPTSDVAAVLSAAGLPQDSLELSIQPLAVRSADRVLLFDTGVGKGGLEGAGKLTESLRAAGIEPAQVSDIFISHGHFDHMGGLVGEAGALVFPNAAIHISAPEWQAVKANPERAALVAAISPKVAPFQPGAAILPGLVTAVPVNGHTPGHSAYEIASGDERLLYIGDTAHHYVVSVRQPDWTIQFDGEPRTAEASRRALLQRAVDQNLRIYAVHFPFPGLGRVKPEGDGFAWVPEAR
ncbi:MAG: MBL fold metallo-hydrolase [Phenylobacterium sp.]|uniref:MBL fold metallo-hydrolase n=1 Tax=Phenylobacterium sp. TaxID=1871053 RepID=UPI0039193D77